MKRIDRDMIMSRSDFRLILFDAENIEQGLEKIQHYYEVFAEVILDKQ